MWFTAAANDTDLISTQATFYQPSFDPFIVSVLNPWIFRRRNRNLKTEIENLRPESSVKVKREQRSIISALKSKLEMAKVATFLLWKEEKFCVHPCAGSACVGSHVTDSEDRRR